ncbi:MAG: fluoride efflux transporter CrcB [Candidatus Cloacimonetes bacterium]|nr:fluoride efflux transporter CrcB [Candidatus Cloacimonadota bacterium]MCF7867667.1 fluoride efflux transporter CrcB [Candidatus Cloacimonadota bacterium]MCF7883535.1 fluoride efflux transporter CrcB [Candidatus Cloacimonadota bacterium]
MEFLLVGIGGFLGAVSRYGLSRVIHENMTNSHIPLGTITVNVIGAFLFSYLLTANYYKLNLSAHTMLLLGTGFLGAFTTFSTFTHETLTVFEQSLAKGLLYASIMLIAGYGSAIAGYVLGRVAN